jgi:predicted phage terminase large subunit-like protein
MSESEATQGLSYAQLLILAKSSPSGLAWVSQLQQSSHTNQLSSRWIHAKHVDYLDDYLVRLSARELQKEGYRGLIIEEPPRHGKSELCSHYFPAWYLGQFPNDRVILTSYEADFAAEWGAKVRGTLEEFGREVFGVAISKTSKARDRWDVSGYSGGMKTAGAGGPITGRGGHLAIIDDPIKNYEEAQSETIRAKIWNWYLSTFRTRLEPNAIVLVIMTRWHEDDLIGRILNAQEEDSLADRYLRIRLPMLAEENDPLGREPGQPLFPERYDLNAAINIRASVREVAWNAMYQQNPIPPEGGMFRRGHFRLVGAGDVPKMKRIVRRWDTAATAKSDALDPDYTVGLKVGLGTDGEYYVLDMVRGQWSTGVAEQRMRETAMEDEAGVRQRAEQEPGSQGKSYMRHLAQKVFRGKPFRARRSTGSKKVRADFAAGFVERREVNVLRASWTEDFLYELSGFPNLKHDDIVDAFSGALDDLVGKGGAVTTW